MRKLGRNTVFYDVKNEKKYYNERIMQIENGSGTPFAISANRRDEQRMSQTLHLSFRDDN